MATKKSVAKKKAPTKKNVIKKAIKKTPAKNAKKTVKKATVKNAAEHNALIPPSPKPSASKTTNALIVGVGGQGILLSSEIFADALMRSGYDVKKNEIHGMSQRGGSVTSHVRFGKKVYSPTIPLHEADVVLAFEKLEGYRELPALKPGGTFIVSSEEIMPAPVEIGLMKYPDNLDQKLKAAGAKIVHALSVARELGNHRVANVVLLGVLGQTLSIPVATWKEAICARVKKEFIDINIEAFERGYDL